MKFYIELDDPNQCFTGGQIVTGHVVVELGAPEKTTGVILKCIGNSESQTAGSQSLEQNIRDIGHQATSTIKHENVDHHRTKAAVSKHKTAREQYFLYNILLFGNDDGSASELASGPHTFPFTFELPLGIPSSFQGSSGVVQYFIDCRIKRPTKFDYETRTFFEVLGQLDLNDFPGTVEPVEIRMEKKGLVCCRKGPLGFSFKLNRTGFIPGENIIFTANFYNMSTKAVSTSFEIDQKSSYHAGVTKTSDLVAILRAPGPGIEPGETKVWSEDRVQIPLFLPPTNLGGSTVIGLSYDAKITITLSNGKYVSGTIPIIIGTIPLQGHIVEEGGSGANSAGQSGPQSLQSVVVASGDTTAANSTAEMTKK